MTAVFLRWQKQTQHHSKHTNKNKWHDKLINILSFQASSISCMCHSFCTSMIHRSIQELRRVNWHLANHVLIMSYPEALLGWCLGFSLCLTLWLCLWLRLHLWTGGTTCICSGLMWMKMLAGELGGFDRLVLPPNHQKKENNSLRSFVVHALLCLCLEQVLFSSFQFDMAQTWEAIMVQPLPPCLLHPSRVGQPPPPRPLPGVSVGPTYQSVTCICTILTI